MGMGRRKVSQSFEEIGESLNSREERKGKMMEKS